MGSYTLKQGAKADGTSKIFFIGSDGQLVEGGFSFDPSLVPGLPTGDSKSSTTRSGLADGIVEIRRRPPEIE